MPSATARWQRSQYGGPAVSPLACSHCKTQFDSLRTSSFDDICWTFGRRWRLRDGKDPRTSCSRGRRHVRAVRHDVRAALPFVTWTLTTLLSRHTRTVDGKAAWPAPWPRSCSAAARVCALSKAGAVPRPPTTMPGRALLTAGDWPGSFQVGVGCDLVIRCPPRSHPSHPGRVGPAPEDWPEPARVAIRARPSHSSHSGFPLPAPAAASGPDPARGDGPLIRRFKASDARPLLAPLGIGLVGSPRPVSVGLQAREAASRCLPASVDRGGRQSWPAPHGP